MSTAACSSPWREITGEAPPETPVSAQTYTQQDDSTVDIPGGQVKKLPGTQAADKTEVPDGNW